RVPRTLPVTLDFERGSADSPCGHALVYFSNPTDGATLATYIVVLPISLQLAKYIPPMLAAQLPMLDLGSTGAVPIPPVPQPVESRDFLERLADLRRDDLIAVGTLNPGDVGRAMTLVADTAQQSAQLYETGLKPLPSGSNETNDGGAGGEICAKEAIHGPMDQAQTLMGV